MFRNLTSSSRNSAMVVTTIAALTLVFSYYFFGYVPSQKENYHRQNFRTLNTISKNTNDILTNTNNLATHQIATACHYFLKAPYAFFSNMDDSAFNEQLKTYPDIKTYTEAVEDYLYDSIPNSEIAYIYPKYIPSKEKAKKNNNISIVYNSEDTIALSFPNQNSNSSANNVEYHESSILVEDEFTMENKRFKYGIWVNMQNIISPLVRSETFEDYFLIKGNEIISGKKTGIVIEKLDTLLKNAGGVKSSTVSDLSISGQDYKIFSLPFKLPSGEDVVLCGMVRADQYRQQVMSISGDVVLLVLLIILLVALAFPIAKLLLMSKQERLNSSDVIFTGISIVLGTSIFTLICINLYNFNGPGKITRDGQLKGFSESLENRFVNELKSACRQLHYFDQRVDSVCFDLIDLKKSPRVKQDQTILTNLIDEETITDKSVIRKVDTLSAHINSLDSIMAKDTSYRARFYNYYSNISWVDETGTQRVKWSSAPEPTDKVDVSTRDFFKRINNGTTWAPLDKDLPPFSLESVFSKSTGENVAVIAIKSERERLYEKKFDWWYLDFNSSRLNPNKFTIDFLLKEFEPKAITLSTKMYSVMDPVLPPNYGFCIMDPTGKVLFHSGGAKNLNENFLEDCDNAPELKSAIFSRSSSFLTSKYQNKRYRMNIRPIGKMPLFLVMFHDDEDNKTINTEVLSVTMILTLSYFAFICLLLVLLRLTQWKRTKLRATGFIFEWLWPVQSRAMAYRQTFEFIILFVVVLIVFLFPADSFCSILLTFCTIAIILLFLFLKINQVSCFGKGNTKTKESFDISQLLKGRNSYFVGAVFFHLLLLNMLAWNNGNGFTLLTAFELIGIVLLIFFLKRNKSLLPIKKFNALDFKTSYLFMQVALLLITSMIPVFIFFKIAFDQEIKLHIRHGQIHYAQKINQIPDENLTLFKYENPNRVEGSGELNVYDSVFYNTQVHVGNSSNQNQFFNYSNDAGYKTLLQQIRPTFNPIASEEQNLAASNENGAMTWGETESGILFLQNAGNESKNGDNNKQISIVSHAPVYQMGLFSANSPDALPTIFAWFELIVFVILLFAFMRFIFSKIFATDFFEGNEFIPTGIDQDIASFKSKNIFMIGAPSSGKRSWLKEIYGVENKFLVIDLVNLDSTEAGNEFLQLSKGFKTIILDHFEYGLNDFDLGMRKLSLLTRLMSLRDHNLIILSSVHPTTFMEEMENTEKNNLELDGKEEDKKKKKSTSSVRFETDKWTSLLGDFYKIYFPLQTMVVLEENQDVPQFIRNECRHSPFLLPIEKAMTEFVRSIEAQNHPVSEEEIILQIQSMAHVYYESLWNSLSCEEQYTIFDLAQDGLANTNNREVIVMLLNKGILVYEDKLKVMNRSFQNFVLTEVSLDRILSIEKNNLPAGRWASIKSPLVIVLVAVAIFIFATQQEEFNKIIAFITTFAAGLPILLKLVSMISVKGSSK